MSAPWHRRSPVDELSTFPWVDDSVTIFQAVVLGIVQGLAELLPISSSAHLALTPYFFGWTDPGLAFDVALHLGTLIALVWYFRAEWIDMTKSAWHIASTRRIDTCIWSWPRFPPASAVCSSTIWPKPPFARR
jgi:hypothetical protein